MLETYDGIVGIAHEVRQAVHHLGFVHKPETQDVVQVHVRQERADESSLRCTVVRG